MSIKIIPLLIPRRDSVKLSNYDVDLSKEKKKNKGIFSIVFVLYLEQKHDVFPHEVQGDGVREGMGWLSWWHIQWKKNIYNTVAKEKISLLGEKKCI